MPAGRRQPEKHMVENQPGKSQWPVFRRRRRGEIDIDERSVMRSKGQRQVLPALEKRIGGKQLPVVGGEVVGQYGKREEQGERHRNEPRCLAQPLPG